MDDIRDKINHPEQLTDAQLSACIREVRHDVGVMAKIVAGYEDAIGGGGIPQRLKEWRGVLSALEAEQQRRAWAIDLTKPAGTPNTFTDCTTKGGTDE